MPDGVAVIDKPAGWTSHDVVAKARGVLGTRKVGHSGTLDPDATGVLVLGVGRATRLLRYVTGLPKSYEAEIVLGVETDTLDSTGQVTARHDMAGVSAERIRAAVAALTGEILQVPPMVSAVKVGGRRLHALARAGVEVEREARPVTVHRFDVAPVPGTDAVLGGRAGRRANPVHTGEAVTERPSGRSEQERETPRPDATGLHVPAQVLRAVVECSSGTYVRTLAADLGRALGGGAHLRNLRRTAVGGFGLDAARPIESAEVLPMAHAVEHLAGVRVAPAVAAQVAHGRVLDLGCLGVADPLEPGAPSGPWAVHDADGQLLAVYERFRDGAKPAVVVAGHPAP